MLNSFVCLAVNSAVALSMAAVGLNLFFFALLTGFMRFMEWWDNNHP